jgi:hypothetical protein
MSADGRLTTEDEEQNRETNKQRSAHQLSYVIQHPKSVGAGGDSAPEPGEALVD